MKHKHHDLIVQWAADTSLPLETKVPNGCWVKARSDPRWFPENEYRFVDPYRELKEAFHQGETIQVSVSGVWHDLPTLPYLFSNPVSSYRIKPKTSTIKYCAFESNTGEVFWSILGSESYANRLINGMKRIPELDKDVKL